MESQTTVLNDPKTAVAHKLNELLANYQVFYQNLRYFHWNVRGHSFFALHAKFEELYRFSAETIDTLAERILALGEVPTSFFSDYLNQSHIGEARGIADPDSMVHQTLEELETLIRVEQEVMEMVGETRDYATDSLISDNLAALQKNVWMLAAFVHA